MQKETHYQIETFFDYHASDNYINATQFKYSSVCKSMWRRQVECGVYRELYNKEFRKPYETTTVSSMCGLELENECTANVLHRRCSHMQRTVTAWITALCTWFKPLVYTVQYCDMISCLLDQRQIRHNLYVDFQDYGYLVIRNV